MSSYIQTAMIIDDDADFCTLLTSILETRKIRVMSVNSITEAESCLSYLSPTFIFLDNSFPDGLGINLIKNIRTADPDIKIIMTTGEHAGWIEKKAREEGINYFLRKPCTGKLINQAIDTVIATA